MAKILVADDELEIIQFCTFVLNKNGHTVIHTENGPQAIDMMKDEHPDLMIMDVMIPGMDGYTIQLQVSQNDDLLKIPVIVMSALKPAKTLFDKFPQVVAFLSKPFEAEDLLGAVKQALEEAKK